MRNWAIGPLGGLEEKSLFESNEESQWFCCRATLMFKLQIAIMELVEDSFTCIWDGKLFYIMGYFWGVDFFWMHFGWEIICNWNGRTSTCSCNCKCNCWNGKLFHMKLGLQTLLHTAGTGSSSACSVYSTDVTLRLSLVSNQRIIFAILATTNTLRYQKNLTNTRNHRIRSFLIHELTE